MAAASTGPKIPLGLGEMLHVSLTHVLNYVAANGTYPPDMAESIRKVLNRYDRDRTQALVMQNVPSAAIAQYTDFAAAKWLKWMTEERQKSKTRNLDFDLWAKELESERDE